MNKNKLLALLLVAVLIVGMIPTVWANEGETDDVVVEITDPTEAVEADEEYSENDAYVAPLLFANAAPFNITPSIENESVETSKTVIYDEETGTYKLVLESYVTGASTTTNVASTKPTDFVISLDTSHSMVDCINCGKTSIESTSSAKPTGSYTSCKVYASDLNRDATYYRSTNGTNKVTYCTECMGWFAASHWPEDGGHGSTSDVRYLPFETASDKASTIDGGAIQFYEDRTHEHDETCAEGCTLTETRVPVYVTDPDFSTEKTYYCHATSTSATYVCNYCVFQNKWYSGSHKHCTGGNVRIPKENAEDKTSGTITFYEDHECTDECAENCELIGTRVAVYTSDPGFSTEKTYFRTAKTTETTETYVCKYCNLCNKWNSGAHKQSCSGGTERVPFERGTYDQTKYVQFYTECISLLKGAKNAIAAFVDEVYEKSKGPDGIAGTEDDVHHRVALTGFSGEPSGGQMAIDYRPYSGSWSRSGIFSVWNPNLEEAAQWYPNISADVFGSIETQNFVSYDNIDSTSNANELARAEYFYSHALRDVTSEVEMNVLDEGLEDYAYEYGTQTHEGAIMAEKIFEHNPDPNRNRVFVLFTDGEPSSSAASPALQAASRIKNHTEYTATIYSVGTFSSASAENIFPLPSQSTNKFLTLMSSNYTNNSTTANNAAGKKYTWDDVNPILLMKDADGNFITDSAGNRVFNVWRTDENYDYILDADGNKIARSDKGAYYLTADNGEGLVKAFESIAQSSTTGGAQIQLSESTMVQDVMSANWVIDNGDSGREIEAYTMTYTGNAVVDGKTQKQWKRATEEEGGEITTLEVELTTVTVKETVIENGVGVEKEVAREAVQVTGFSFSQHYVGIDKSTEDGITTETPRGKKLVMEIPIKPAEDNNGGKAQLTNNSAQSGIMVGNTFVENFDSPSVDLPVNVTFQKVLEGGDPSQFFTYAMNWKSFGGYEDEDNVGANANYLQAVEQSKRSTISVTPGNTTTFANLVDGSTMIITEQIDANYMVEVSVDGGKTFLAAPQEVGSITDAVVDDEADEESPEEDVPVEDEGENGEVEGEPEEDEDDSVESAYSLKLTRNADGSVTVEIEISSGMAIVFRNTLLVTDLTITKNLTSPALEDQVFFFHLQGSDANTADYSVEVVLIVPKGTNVGTVTIKDVLVGEYTVTEDQNWSWRYDLKDVTAKNDANTTRLTNGIIFALTVTGEEVTFTNTRTEDQWLTGDNFWRNLFDGVGTPTEPAE